MENTIFYEGFPNLWDWHNRTQGLINPLVYLSPAAVELRDEGLEAGAGLVLFLLLHLSSEK